MGRVFSVDDVFMNVWWSVLTSEALLWPISFYYNVMLITFILFDITRVHFFTQLWKVLFKRKKSERISGGFSIFFCCVKFCIFVIRENVVEISGCWYASISVTKLQVHSN